MADAINVEAGGLGPPMGTTPAMLNMMVIDDIVPPRWPDGCMLVLQRPGELGVVATIGPIPTGCMLVLIPPAAAVHMRPVLEQMKKQMAKEQEMLRRNAAMG